MERAREYMSYARNPNVKTICEIGFAGGHSTVAYLTANPTATIYSFDDFRKAELTQTAYEILKSQGAITLYRGDPTSQLPKFSAEHPDVYCDIISVDGAHHADLTNFKYLAAYPNVVLIDDYHEKDWLAFQAGVANRVREGSMKLRHVAADPLTASSIIFGNKQKQWAIGEYTMVTIVVATMDLSRLPGLKNNILDVAIKHPVVQQVIVIWNGGPMPEKVAQLARPPRKAARVTVIQKDVNSLNNRYDPSLPIHTGAVMVVDDDMKIQAETITCAFNAWKRDPFKLYSYGEGRSVTPSGYGYDSPGMTIGDPRTNFLLPRLIFHVDFLAEYFGDKYSSLRSYVDTQGAHCDDIAFAAVVTKYTQSPMHYIPAPYTDKQGAGLGHQTDRLTLRNECAKEIVKMLDWTMPTVVAAKC